MFWSVRPALTIQTKEQQEEEEGGKIPLDTARPQLNTQRPTSFVLLPDGKVLDFDPNYPPTCLYGSPSSALNSIFVKNRHMTFHQTNPRLSERSHEELHLMTQQEKDEVANDSENITAGEETFSLSEKKHERATFCK